MKKKLLSRLGTLLILVSVIVAFTCSNHRNEVFNANIEALMQEEGATITCSATICGRCFEEKKAWPYYKCNWTGSQSDYCECDKVGWL